MRVGGKVAPGMGCSFGEVFDGVGAAGEIRGAAGEIRGAAGEILAPPPRTGLEVGLGLELGLGLGLEVGLDCGGKSAWGWDHPPNKNELSRRLALQTVHAAYAQQVCRQE